MKKITLLLALFAASLSYGQFVISEVDSDQTGTDSMEFIEISGAANASLDGFVVVLFNGSDDASYDAIDLDGFSTDANGYFILANDGFPGQDVLVEQVQNGPDAVAIYQADASDFPEDTPVTMTNLIDAIVYGTNDDDDVELLAGLGETVQYNEDANNNGADTESIQRAPDGTYCVGTPTPDADNIDCGAVCPLSVTVMNVSCDAVTAGTDTYTTTLSFTGGGTETYTISATDGTVGGDDPSSVATGTITISGVDEGVNFDYSVTSTLCDISNTINAPTCVPASDVANIAALRAGTIGEDYTLTGEAVLTFQRSERNQKWIEDATGAILIDDSNGTITTAYNLGDGISGIAGTLSEFAGVLQFRPSQDPGAASSTNNQLDPQQITLATYVANFGDYESELISFTDVTYTAGDGTAVFEEDMDYDVTGGGATVIHRTNFNMDDVDYIGQLIPQGTIATMVALGGRFNDTPQLLIRRYIDIDGTLGTNDTQAATVSVYPNPATNGFVNISSRIAGNMNVQVFNVLGKQVISTTITNRLDVSNLSSGVYILKVTQENTITTKKLVIK